MSSGKFWACTIIALGAFAQILPAQTVLFVSEYGTGNLRAYNYTTGNSISLPSGYTPVAGSSTGADGMVTDASGRLYVNRGDGTISRRNPAGDSFSTFATISGASDLLDLTRNSTHLFAARYGFNTIYQVALADASVTTISGPSGATRFDGLRIGPDGRLYAVDSSDGDIFAYDFASSTWSTFLSSPLSGDASQIEFGSDNRVFISRTISGQARIYSYSLNVSGNFSSGLNPSSQTLIGTFGNSTTATGIRIGPDNRLYANSFNAGEVWRSNVGITAMESSAFITGLSFPGSLYFTAIPEVTPLSLLALAFGWLILRRQRKAAPLGDAAPPFVRI